MYIFKYDRGYLICASFNFTAMRHAQTNPFWLGSACCFYYAYFSGVFYFIEILLTQRRQRETYIQRLSQIDSIN